MSPHPLMRTRQALWPPIQRGHQPVQSWNPTRRGCTYFAPGNPLGLVAHL